MYLGDASKRYPGARVLAPRGLRAKRADLMIHGALEDEQPELAAHVDVLPIRGAPSMDEFVFFHRATATLVVTDLVFNVEQPQGLLANVILFVVGCHGRLATRRVWYTLVKDRALVRSSMESIVTLPVRTLIMAHGAIVRRDARERLVAALQARFMGRALQALPAPGG